MKVIVIGGSGTIGSAVVRELSQRHQILIAGHTEGDLICDIASEDSIRNMFEKAGEFHALIVAAGMVHFEDFAQMTPAKYKIGLSHKLLF